MSATVKLSSKMPGDPDTNGVDAQAGNLVSEPADVRVAVIWFDVSKVTVDTDTDDHIPTIRVRRIEPIGLVGEVDAGIQAAVERAVENRTGRKAIPFGVVEVDQDGAYGDPDQLAIDDEVEEGDQ